MTAQAKEDRARVRNILIYPKMLATVTSPEERAALARLAEEPPALAAQSAPLRTVEEVARALGAGILEAWDSVLIPIENGKDARAWIARGVFAAIVAAAQSSAPPTEGHPDEKA